jgi:hypothetical protein
MISIFSPYHSQLELTYIDDEDIDESYCEQCSRCKNDYSDSDDDSDVAADVADVANADTDIDSGDDNIVADNVAYIVADNVDTDDVLADNIDTDDVVPDYLADPKPIKVNIVDYSDDVSNTGSDTGSDICSDESVVVVDKHIDYIKKAQAIVEGLKNELEKKND